MTTGNALTAPPMLAVGDGRRPVLGRAIGATLALGATFLAYLYLTKEIRPLYDSAPWQDDPYDAIVSFAIFFLPALLGLSLLRMPLYRPDRPLPVQGVRDLLRASWVILAIMVITELSDWLAVLSRTHEATWTTATAATIALLGLGSLLTLIVARRLVRASRQPLPTAAGAPSPTDWLGDLFTVGVQTAQRLGRFGRPLIGILSWLEGHPLRGARRRPLVTSAVVGIAFGAFIAFGASLEEGVGPVLLLFFGVASAGMFAFVAAVGSYLGLVHRSSPLTGAYRRLAYASVASSASVPITLAFRDSLWWILGTSGTDAGLPQLLSLLVLVAGVIFVLVFAIETVARPRASLR